MDNEPSEPQGDFVEPPGTSQQWVGPAFDHSSGPSSVEGSPVWYETSEAPLPPPVVPRRRRRRVVLPLLLFLATCLSTFVSWTIWPALLMADESSGVLSAALIQRWPSGVVYMTAVMAILVAHEMGHFLQAVRYHVPASLPFFIPMPFPPIGTMGAVIAMPSSKADRRQLFDIGISGPLAGLVLAIPVAWLGIRSAEIATFPPAGTVTGAMYFQDPLIFKAITHFVRPELRPNEDLVQNPLLLAGWVGMLITGLNMLPISQLDGGHVAYSLFGRRAHWLAWTMVGVAAIFIAVTGQYGWMLMLALVVYLGPSHPPTANDHVPLGWVRRLVGLASLLIPVFCFVPIPISTI